MKVTLDDLAAKTGLSKSTISRVVTNAGSVSAKSRTLIENAIEELGYKKSKKRPVRQDGQSKTIVVISRDLCQETHIHYIKALTRFFFDKNYIVCAIDCNLDPEIELMYLKHASDNHFAGVFLLSYIGITEHSEIIKNLDCPVVLVNHYPRSLDLDVVNIDNYHAGMKSAQYLLENGHRRIALLCGPDRSATSRNRIWGFLDTLHDVGIELPEENIIQTDFSYEQGYAYGKKIAEERLEITAVFCTSRPLADGLIDALLHYNMRIPEDVSIICTSHIPTHMPGRPNITTVCHDDNAIAFAAGELLLERMRESDAPKRSISYSPILVEGDSVIDIG